MWSRSELKLLKNPAQLLHDSIEDFLRLRPAQLAVLLRLDSRLRPRTRNVELGAGIDPAIAQRLLEDLCHDRQRAASALAPRAHRHLVVEAYPRACHQLGMHHDEPAIGVLL